MTASRAKSVRTSELIQEVLNHKHKDELIDLMFEQLEDDNRFTLVSNFT